MLSAIAALAAALILTPAGSGGVIREGGDEARSNVVAASSSTSASENPDAALPTATAKGRAVVSTFILKFSSFVSWPPPPPAAPKATEFVVGIIGDDPLGATIDKMAKTRSVGGVPVKIVRLDSAKVTAEQLTACRILFVTATERKQWPRIRTLIGKAPVLTISEMPGFSKERGMVELKPKGGRVSLTVHRTQLESVGMKASANLLRLSTIVED